MSNRATLPSRKRKTWAGRLVFKPVRLRAEWFAFEIADGLPDFCDDRAVRGSMKAYRVDARTDHGPLVRPVLSYCFAPMNVATIHAIGSDDIIGEHDQHAVDVPGVKTVVDAPKEFDLIIHGFLLGVVPHKSTEGQCGVDIAPAAFVRTNWVCSSSVASSAGNRHSMRNSSAASVCGVPTVVTIEK